MTTNTERRDNYCIFVIVSFAYRAHIITFVSFFNLNQKLTVSIIQSYYQPITLRIVVGVIGIFEFDHIKDFSNLTNQVFLFWLFAIGVLLFVKIKNIDFPEFLQNRFLGIIEQQHVFPIRIFQLFQLVS